jgi:predicted AlkP superfamily pyrophosphatase or phosphodiesterase
MSSRVVVLSIPQLRLKDVTPGALASLESLAGRGGVVEFEPAFPSLAAPSFATLVTGQTPARHGIVGDAFFDRVARRVRRRPFADADVPGPKLWDRLAAARPGATTLAWLTPSLRGAAVQTAAWVEADDELHTEPPDLAARLEGPFGAYPAPRAGVTAGERPRLAATSWILKSAARAIAETNPALALVRIPYLGQVARRHGPDGREASRSVVELEGLLKPFLASLPKDVLVVAVTESVSTPVTAPVYPNRVLRELGLLELRPAPGGGLDVDLEASAAFAVADHQLGHVVLNDPGVAATVAAAFSGPDGEGVATVASGRRRIALGLGHAHAGDIVLVAEPDHWFAPHWWETPAERPTTIPSGLATAASRDPAQVRGSLGAPAPNPSYHGVLVASQPGVLAGLGPGQSCTACALTGRLARALGLPDAP